MLTDNEFCTATTDIHHQFFARIGLGMGNPHVDQAGFFLAGNHFYVIRQNVECFFQQNFGILRFTQSVSGCDPDIFRIEPLQALAKHGQAFNGSRDGIVGKHFLVIQAGSQANPLLMAADNLYTVFHHPGNNHVETV